MAEHTAPVAHDTTMDGAPPRSDIADHQRTFDGFIWLTKWTIATVVIILILMTIFLV